MGDLSSPGASAPRDILIDLETGEFVLSAKGDLQFVSGAQAIRQALTIRLRFRAGEWFLDTTAGMPWLSLLGQKFNAETARGLLRAELLKCPGVDAVTALDLAFDPATRTLRVNWSVSTDYGQLDGSTKVPPK